jgi:hypothetical protein
VSSANAAACPRARETAEVAETPVSEAELIASHKQAALSLMIEAFEVARADGIEGDCVAQAALFTALKEFVSTYGEDAVAVFTERLPERVRNGEFSIRQPH